MARLILLDQHIAIWVWVHSQSVQRVQLAGSVEHILINLSILAAQTAVQLPIRELPSVNQAQGMRSDVSEELHDRLCADELDLADCESGGGVELRSLLLEGAEGEEAEELVHGGDGDGVELVGEGRGLQGVVEVLDDEVLRVCGGQAPEVDEERVPRLLLDVAVLEGLKGEVRCAPREGGDDVAVVGEDVKGAALVLCVQEGAEDLGRVVGGCLALEHGARRLEEVACNLLGQHVVVSLPGGGWEVVGIPAADTRELGVTVATASSSAHLQALSSNGAAERLKTARSGVEISKHVAA